MKKQTRSSPSEFGLSQLSVLHDMMLDRVMFDLLLRQRHQKVMELLEDILNLVLQASSLLELDSQQDLKADFTSKTRLFIEVCERLSQQPGLKISDDVELEVGLKKSWSAIPSDGLEVLVAALNMNDFYTKSQ